MNQSLSFKEKISYAAGAVGKDMVYSLVSGFILYYYNTVLGISGTFTGIMMMAARVFDAFNDPMMGVVVEKTHTKLGKFRPWILTGTITNALVLFAMFSVPEKLKGSPMLIWATVAYFLWGITYTLMDIPFWSMIPAITKTGKDRENLSVIGRTASSVGFAIPTVCTMLLVTRIGGSERAGFMFLAAVVGAIFIITELVTFFGVKEQRSVSQDTPSVKEMFRSLFSNDQALVIVISIILFNTSLYTTTQLALYFFKYDIGNSDLYSLFGTIGGGAQILSMASLPILRKKWSSKSILSSAICITIFGYLFLFLLGTFSVTNVALLGVSAFIIYIGFGLATVLTTIFLADTVDYGEWKNGKRNESVIFSMQTFVVKLASAVSVLVAGVGIDIIGLDTEAEVQSAGTIFGLRFIMTIIPIMGLIAAILYFRKKYILTEEKNKEIADELTSRKA
ncbi:MAG: glycoside-pentoside-hexuronide (GPH):cation symporter [Clostridia bacterium]|nr:glycoside-pentoside-hexuronide (GPH):cation symporter [Clostridia bacterium]